MNYYTEAFDDKLNRIETYQRYPLSAAKDLRGLRLRQ